ncbi:MAG: repeat-containing protein, partial [Bryobacterales bacterium]|nr:repeat-containing protein [Bryobacterales bacterium]
ATAVPVGAKVSATFSSAMNPATVSGSTFTLTQGLTPVGGAVSYAGTTATFTPSGNLAPSTTFTGTITTGAKDQNGSGLASNYVWSFTTGSAGGATAPTVISTNPSSGATGVGNAVKPTATFSAAMDAATITGASFTLAQGSSPVAGAVTYSGSTATFAPSTPLTLSTVYTATVTTAAKDLGGNALASNYVWSFTTGTAATLPPVITSTVNAASYTSPVAAGSIAAVFGTNLGSARVTSAPPPPMLTTLGQTSVSIGGQAAPLYLVVPAQVNIQIPWSLAGQTQAPIAVAVNGLTSNIQLVPLAPMAPAIFSVDATGTGQGAVLVATSGQLAATGTPAARGAYISIYCTGLGAVTNQPATGAASPTSPLALTVLQPSVTVGGVAAVVSYSGLAPTLVGLYQVNAVIGSGASTGNAVPVVITIGNVTSNTVTIAVQ